MNDRCRSESLLNDENNSKKLENSIEKLIFKEDAYYSSNFFSKIFFYWGFKLVRLANLTTIKNEYLGQIHEKNQSKTGLMSLHKIWHNNQYKKRKKCALLCTWLRANSSRFLFLCIISSFTFLFEFLSLYAVNEIINHFQGKSRYDLSLLTLGISYLILKFMNLIIQRQQYIYLSFLGNSSAVELNCFILDKAFKSSPSTFGYKATEGEIINFIQIDSLKLKWLIDVCPNFFLAPVRIIVYTIWLFDFFGKSFIYGLFAMIIIIVINFFLKNKEYIYKEETLKKTDERMRITTETINSLKLLKLYSWEDEFLNRILKAREEEIEITKKFQFYMVFSVISYYFAPVIVAVVTIGIYQTMSDSLNVADMLMGITLFQNLKSPFQIISSTITSFLESYISLQRIERYLLQDEILNENSKEDLSLNKISIKFHNCNFTWGSSSYNTYNEVNNVISDNKSNVGIDSNNINLNLKDCKIGYANEENNNISNHSYDHDYINRPSNKDENIILFSQVQKIDLRNISFEIEKGLLVGIIGIVGSGKSSLLQAIINNLILIDKEKHQSEMILNGSVSYLSQNPWILNETLRENILFFKNYENYRYNSIIDICQLKKDFNLLPGGDLTEIGEKGINLSGGQRSRVALARAIYADSDIYLLDDPLSALDANVGDEIMTKCIINHLREKTRLVVTNSFQYLSLMDKIIFIDKGCILFYGSYEELKSKEFFTNFSKKKEKESEKDIEKNKSSEEDDEFNENNNELLRKDKSNIENVSIEKIIEEEDRGIGHIKLNTYFKFFEYYGGLSCGINVLIATIFWCGLNTFSDIWITIWSGVNDKEQNTKYYLIYCFLCFFSLFSFYFHMSIKANGSLICGKRLHKEMITNLINAPINLFHDKTPKGRIFNRLSRDLDQIRESQHVFGFLIGCLVNFICSVIVCTIYNYFSIIFMILMMIIGIYITKFYLCASRDLTRMHSIARSPILNTLSEALPGVITIRAYKYEDKYLKKYTDRLDDLFKIQMFITGTYNWYGLTMDIVVFIFLTFIIIFIILFEDKFSSSSIGILLIYIPILQYNLFYLLNTAGNFANDMVSMERCLNFTNLKVEKSMDNQLQTNYNINENYIEKDVLNINSESSLLINWPYEGKIDFVNFSVKYRPETELVLKNININILSREKIGIVGRTGSGKSTICLSIFRLLEPHLGTICIDNIDITNIDLKLLRRKLTIIPQEPNLVKGTLKYNIDPLELINDNEIEAVMKSIGFWYICENNEKGLYQEIIENGDNVSAGEKQMICITRAILRRSKIVVMDEATANIDAKTENIIQNAMNEIFKHSTIITIAHRIKTIINYDRILVLNEGEVIEFDTPNNLMKNKNSLFFSLYKKANK